MPACPVFASFAGAESVWDEVYRLVAEIPEAFAPHGLTLKLLKKAGHGDTHTGARTAFPFSVTGGLGKSRRTRQLIFLFDLWRTGAPDGWPHAREALLTTAYARSEKGGAEWEIAHLPIGVDGRLENATIRESCKPHADGRLLEYDEDMESWPERAWLFSVPLMSINGPVAFRTHVADPVAALLNGKTPRAALARSGAVRLRGQ